MMYVCLVLMRGLFVFGNIIFVIVRLVFRNGKLVFYIGIFLSLLVIW